MVESVRHKILRTMAETFAAVSEPDYPLKFSTVGMGPLSEADHKKRFSIGIVPGPEQYKHSFPYIERLLDVAIEFRITVNRTDPDPGELAETVLTVVEQVVAKNRTWGGLALDTDYKTSELDMTTYDDKTIMGVLWVTVHYRHAHGDPTDPNPSV